MSAIKSYMHWFLIGMGNVMGISHSIPPLRRPATEIEAVGGDFRAIGNDFRYVIHRTPARAESQAGQSGPAQLELAGLS